MAVVWMTRTRGVLEPSTRVHLVGIGGIGMSGIAELLVTLGHDVQGSDLARSPVTDRLEALGVRFTQGHDPANIGNADLVVVSTAVPADNAERMAAVARGIPVVARGRMLAELTKTRRTVAIVGAHGKTTTSSMIAVLLAAAGFDPTAVIGGRLGVFGSSARLGEGPFMVVEADESDRSFLWLEPEIAVLTNIDDEHLEAYDGPEDLESSFLTFARRAAEHGCAVACADDPRLRRLAAQVPGRLATYGLQQLDAEVRGSSVMLGPTACRMVVEVSRGPHAGVEVDVALPVPGRHNAQNALAAFAVGLELGLAPSAIADALATFTGADRRFQDHGTTHGVAVIDDYAHHPTEIAAVLQTARLRRPARLRVIFQPHRYTRTSRLLDRFAEVLATADEVVLTEVYPAGEAEIPGATSDALARAIQAAGLTSVSVVSLQAVVQAVVRDARPGDLVLTLGAGSIGRVPSQLVAALQARGGGR